MCVAVDAKGLVDLTGTGWHSPPCHRTPQWATDTSLLEDAGAGSAILQDVMNRCHTCPPRRERISRLSKHRAEETGVEMTWQRRQRRIQGAHNADRHPKKEFYPALRRRIQVNSRIMGDCDRNYVLVTVPKSVRTATRSPLGA
jgi:hypothetical protein